MQKEEIKKPTCSKEYFIIPHENKKYFLNLSLTLLCTCKCSVVFYLTHWSDFCHGHIQTVSLGYLLKKM